MIPYSQLKEKLSLGSMKPFDEGIAFLTHYLQNDSNGVSEKYRNKAFQYLEERRESNTKLKDVSLHNLSPVQWDVPFPSPASHDFTFIDLFAGIGGFRIPLQEMNGKCVFTSEFNYFAQKSYELNFGKVPFGDITKVDLDIIPEHDVLCGGFPCQPFSISGKMKGFEDTRGTLIYNVLQIIERRKPTVVFLENVKHLVHHDKGRTLATILKHLEELGYVVSTAVLNASEFGVAQNRERIVIVGHAKKKFDFANVLRKPRQVLKDILETDIEFEYLSEPYTILQSPKTQRSGLIFVGHRNKKIRQVGVRPGTEHLSRVHKQPNRIYSSEGLHPALPSQESTGRFWIYNEGRVRKLTIRECYRIMGFPEEFKLIDNTSALYRQIGNSVCVPMIREIAREIKRQLLIN